VVTALAYHIHQFGPIIVKIKHLWRKSPSSPWYYRRRIPKDVLHAYTSSTRQIALKTRDDTLAAKRVVMLTRQDDETWDRMRRGVSSIGDRGRSEELLARFSLEAVPFSEQDVPEINYEQFIVSLENKVPGDEHPRDHLAPHELRAMDILSGTETYTLADAKQLYLKKKDALEARPDNRKIRNGADAAFAMVFNTIGDRELSKYRRRDVSTVIDAARASGLKTQTVKRRLAIVRASVNLITKEYEIDLKLNAFADFEIPNLGSDSHERVTLNAAQVITLREHVHKTESDTANIIGLLLDTGARIAEVVGLWCEDVVLDHETPHIVIHENAQRRLKTKASVRKVPLVGAALESANRALALANGKYLFDRYMTDTEVKNGNASAAVGKVTKRLGCETAHSMRHTMKSRLRNADVPEPRANEIQGWSRESVADKYGEQTALRNLQADLLKTLI